MTAAAPGPRPPGAPPRVLIIKTSSMGDVVHALPAATDIARAHPGAVIDWLAEAPFAAIPALHRDVRRVFPLGWRKWRKRLHEAATWRAIAALRGQLRAERYDCVIDLQGLVKSALWAAQAHGPRAGYAWQSAREPLASVFYGHRADVPGVGELHAVERCRRLAASALGHPMPATPPDFGLRAPEAQWRAPPGHAAFIPCASRPEKLWPEAHWRRLVADAEARGLTPVLLWGGAAEQALAGRIAAGSGAVVPPFLSVGDTAAVLAGARVVAGLDTGFTHLAAAFGRPTVGIYCDYDPGLAGVTAGRRRVRMQPRRPRPAAAARRGARGVPAGVRGGGRLNLRGPLRLGQDAARPASGAFRWPCRPGLRETAGSCAGSVPQRGPGGARTHGADAARAASPRRRVHRQRAGPGRQARPSPRARARGPAHGRGDGRRARDQTASSLAGG